MIHTILPSLKHMAAVSVALLLYKTKDIQRFLTKMDDYPFGMADRGKNKDWRLLKIATQEKMGELLPSKLKPLVVEMLRPLAWEWHYWRKDHYVFYRFSNESMWPDLAFLRLDGTIDSSSLESIWLDIVSWRSDGTIDRTETAKMFIRNKKFSPVHRFLMACMYFQESEIVMLWDEVRNHLPSRNINIVQRFWVRWLTEGREVPWTDMVDELLGDPHQLHSFCPLRVSCFFRALSPENRQKYSVILRCFKVHFDDLRYCFYQMDESERILLYQNDCQTVLASLLRWPFQTIFMPAVNNLWGYLKPDEFYSILCMIINHYILQDVQYFNFLELFKEFWCDSPESHKEHVKRNMNFFKVVELLLSFDEETHPFSIEEVMKMKESPMIYAKLYV